MTETGIVILAAGSSSRLGKPKQLLQWKGKTLIERTVDEATAALLFPIVVITGAEAENVSAVLQNKKATIVKNEAWQLGMASGIATGVEAALSQQKNLKAVIIAVCDQPFVSSTLFQRLLQKKEESGKAIAACAYANTVGTPVLFDEKYFGVLQELSGTDGAKKLLKRYAGDVDTISFEEGAVDIDTEEDYRKLLAQPS